jgi:hypothetical protein
VVLAAVRFSIRRAWCSERFGPLGGGSHPTLGGTLARADITTLIDEANSACDVAFWVWSRGGKGYQRLEIVTISSNFGQMYGRCQSSALAPSDPHTSIRRADGALFCLSLFVLLTAGLPAQSQGRGWSASVPKGVARSLQKQKAVPV